MRRKRLGKKGEQIASRLLKKAGYRLLEKNFTCPFGEIDLIAEEDNDLVFIEVKTRQGDYFGQPEEAVTPKKLAQIQRLGHYYHDLYPKLPKSFRIDVVALTISPKGKIERAKIFRNVSGDT